jgi:O-6-methylguanine DNA methyltransferase
MLFWFEVRGSGLGKSDRNLNRRQSLRWFMLSSRFKTSLGEMIAIEKEGALIHINFLDNGHPLLQTERCSEKTALLGRVEEEVLAYFSGELSSFSVPLAFEGTGFQQEVWRALLAIPYGTTRSYAEIAREIGRPGAARAVGQAVGANPLLIVVPCHRVIASDGGLGGFSGGPHRKQRLLAREQGENHALFRG